MCQVRSRGDERGILFLRSSDRLSISGFPEACAGGAFGIATAGDRFAGVGELSPPSPPPNDAANQAQNVPHFAHPELHSNKTKPLQGIVSWSQIRQSFSFAAPTPLSSLNKTLVIGLLSASLSVIFLHLRTSTGCNFAPSAKPCPPLLSPLTIRPTFVTSNERQKRPNTGPRESRDQRAEEHRRGVSVDRYVEERSRGRSHPSHHF